jgi:hypothetical protein
MQRTVAFCNRTGVRYFVAVLTLALWSSTARATDPDHPLAGVNIIKIEQDWMLDIADPDPVADCPQVVTVFGGADPRYYTHAVFELNHGTQPDYAEGGMQLQVWRGDVLRGYQWQHAPAELNAAIERLTYTTVMELGGGRQKLYVKDGNSITWGDFGDSASASLKIELSSGRQNYNDWDRWSSIRHSRVAYGANRVNKYVRTAIRYYTTAGLHYTDTSDDYVHRLAEDAVAPPPLPPESESPPMSE